jgi:hypothetical protein
MIVSASAGIAFTFGMAFQCSPVSIFWDFMDIIPNVEATSNKCIDITALAWAHAITTLVLGIWVIILPMPVLLKLRLPTEKRVKVYLMFLVGGL